MVDSVPIGTATAIMLMLHRCLRHQKCQVVEALPCRGRSQHGHRHLQATDSLQRNLVCRLRRFRRQSLTCMWEESRLALDHRQRTRRSAFSGWAGHIGTHWVGNIPKTSHQSLYRSTLQGARAKAEDAKIEKQKKFNGQSYLMHSPRLSPEIPRAGPEDASRLNQPH